MSSGKEPLTKAPETAVRTLGIRLSAHKGVRHICVSPSHVWGEVWHFQRARALSPLIPVVAPGIIRKKFGVAWREPLLIGILGLSLSAVLSTFLSTTPFHALFLLKREYLKIILLYCVISATFAHREKLKQLAFFIALVGILYLSVVYLG